MRVCTCARVSISLDPYIVHVNTQHLLFKYDVGLCASVFPQPAVCDLLGLWEPLSPISLNLHFGPR